MLYSVTNAPVSVGVSNPNRTSVLVGTNGELGEAEETRGLEDRSSSAEYKSASERKSLRSTSEAVDFRPEETSLHRLYEIVRSRVESSRTEKIEVLRSLIKNETYQPNLDVAAERLLSSGELGRF